MNEGNAISGTLDLRDYLDWLRARGDLLVVRRPVSGRHELSAVVKALEPHGAPAVWFSAVEGSHLPVVSGLFGTRERIAAALGVPVQDALDHVMERMRHPVPTVTAPVPPPVQQVVQTGDEVDLFALPIGVHSRGDAGAYITSGVTVVRDPVTGNVNTGMYRLMVHGPDTITVNAAPDHDLGRILRTAAAQGQDVPIAVVIGHHPAYLVASQLKHGLDVDSHEVAGALLGRPLEVAPARTIDLDVPAYAEIVLEGVVRAEGPAQEGPFGEFTYYYGAAKAPVCRITAITRRTETIFHDLHPTHAEHRCLWLFPGREARLLDAVRTAVPSTRSVRIPFHGGSLSAYISLDKQHDSDGKQAILAAFARDHFLKHVVAVDTDIDILNDAEVLWALNVRFQADHDLIELTGAKGIRMDPSANRVEVGERPQALTAKLGFDATAPLTPPFPERADLPVEEYAKLTLDEYLDPEDLTVLTERRRVLRLAAE